MSTRKREAQSILIIFKNGMWMKERVSLSTKPSLMMAGINTWTPTLIDILSLSPFSYSFSLNSLLYSFYFFFLYSFSFSIELLFDLF